MLVFNSIDYDNIFDFNNGSDFVIGYARALESLDQYLDKAMLDVSCESSNNTNSFDVNKWRKIWDSIVNFFSSLLAKLKEFVRKYFRSSKSANKEKGIDPNPNKYTGKNAMKYQNINSQEASKKMNNLGDLIYSWWDEVTDVIRNSNIPKETIYKEIEDKYKRDYATLQKTGSVSTKKHLNHNTSIFDDETIDIVPSLGILGEQLNKLKDVKAFLLKLDTRTTDAASGKNTIKKINSFKEADIKQTITVNQTEYVTINSVNHPIEFLVKLLNNAKNGKALSVSAIKDSLRRAVAFIRSQIHCIFSLIKHSVEYLSGLKSYHFDKKQIFKIYKFPLDVKQEIANIIKHDTERGIAGKLPVMNLIITSLDRYSKPNIFKPKYTMGSTSIKGFKHDIGKGINARGSNVVVNYYLFEYPHIDNSITDIAGTIVHECGHIYNAAYQKIAFSGNRKYKNEHASNSKEYTDNYDTDPDEKFANKQESRAKINPSSMRKLISWIKKIVEDLKSVSNSQNNHAGA